MEEKGFARADQVAAAKREVIVARPRGRGAARARARGRRRGAARRCARWSGPEADRGGLHGHDDDRSGARGGRARGGAHGTPTTYEKRHRLARAAREGAQAKKEPAPFDGTPRPGHALPRRGHGRRRREGHDRGAGRHRDRHRRLADAARYNPKGLPASAVRRGRQGRARGRRVQDAGHAAAADGSGGEAEAAPRARPGERARRASTCARAEILALVGELRGRARRARPRPRRTGSRARPSRPSSTATRIHARAMTPATIVETNPAALPKRYQPGNYDEGEGKTPEALARRARLSVNTAAVWSLGQGRPVQRRRLGARARRSQSEARRRPARSRSARTR